MQEDLEVTDPDAGGHRRYQRIYELTRTVGYGEVATYGQIAFVAELSTPRMVGYAMSALPSVNAPRMRPVPWHRVINSQGRISVRRAGNADPRQRALLQAEGVLFDRGDRVNFAEVAWAGPPWEWLEAHGYDIGALIERSMALRRAGPWARWRF